MCESDDEQCELQLYCLDKGANSKNQFRVDVLVNSTNVMCEIDTSAAVSVMSDKIYTQELSSVPLQTTDMVLRSYDGSIIKPVGIMRVSLQHKQKSVACEFVVVRNGGNTLIGRDMLSLLDVGLELNSLREENVTKLIAEFNELFRIEVGCYKYGKIHFEVEPGTKPIFCKPRKVPFAFVDGVNRELDRLIEQGVLVQVPDAQWATPIVPILKKESYQSIFEESYNARTMMMKFLRNWTVV